MLKKISKYLRQIKYGYGIIVDGNTELHNVTFEQFAFVAHHAQITNSYIGNHSSIGRFDKIRDCSIGKYCSISWDCTLGAPSHPLKTITSCALTYRKEYGVVNKDSNAPPLYITKIGNDVWIGCNVTVIGGVEIGNGAVIGAGAVVTRNVPSYEIWAGVPARKIGERFSPDLAKRVNQLSWWDWPLEEQRQMLSLFKEKLNEEILSKIEKAHYIYSKNAEEHRS